MSPSSKPEESTPWFRRWFGEEYLRLYPHRDEDEADEAVRLLLAHVDLESDGEVLDLACGAGRHLRALVRHGVRRVGLDLSEALLRSARATGYAGPLVRGDMRRLPFVANRFTAVTSFFTSFGYFESASDDDRVLSEIARILKPHGHLLLDFLNAEQVRRTLEPRDEGEVEGRRVVQERRLVDGGRAVEKTISIEGKGGGPPEVFHERVRLYSRDDLGTLLSRRGFEALAWFGDYAGTSPSPSSPRTIVLARAPGGLGPTGARPRDPTSNDPSAFRDAT